MAYSPPSFPFFLTAIEGYTPPSLAVLLQLCLEGTPDDIEGTLDAILPLSDAPLTLAAVGLMEFEMWSDVGPSAGLPLTQARATALGLATRAADMRTSQRPAVAPHTEARSAPRGLVAPQTSGLALTRFSELLSGEAIRVSRSARTTATEAQRTERPARLNSAAAQIPFAHGARAPLAERIYTRRGWEIAEHQQGQPTAHRLTVRTRQALTTQTRLLVRQTEAMWPLTGRYWPRYTPPPLELILCCVPWPASPGGLVIAPFTYPRCSIVPVEPGPFIIPTRPFYMRVHELSVVRLPDRTELPWRSLTLRTDASQWAWTMTLELIGRGAAALIDPGAGDVVQVEVSINGATWVCLAEDWTESSQHGQWTTVTVTGRGLTAGLSGRYQRPRSYTEASSRTMAQLADQELPMGDGWSLTWEPADWLVPAGAWTYQDLSPIEAIARLAGDAGALVYAAPAAKSITVRPVYGILPWDYAEGMEQLVVPEAALVGAVSRRYRYPDQANAVHVYGGEVGGIQARVYRDGSAGDVYGADRSSALMTHIDGARALGGRLLAGLAMPPGLSSFTMPIEHAGDFPVVRLGDWARVELSEGAEAGPVTSIQISVNSEGDGTSVRQTLGLGEGVNDYQRLLALIPREPRILGQISSVSTDGTARVTLLGGGIIRVRGTGSVGSWVWCRGGRIEDQAPTMPGYDIGI